MKCSEIKKGDVFLITMNKSNGIIPKLGDKNRNKYFVVFGFDNNGNVFGGVVFNSFINLNLPHYIQACQCLIKGEDYAFLSHDSYIDCSSIKTVKKAKLLKSEYSGSLKEKDIEMVYEKLKNNSRINKADLKRFSMIDEIEKKSKNL